MTQKEIIIVLLSVIISFCGMAYYEREFIDYRMNGCQCPPPQTYEDRDNNGEGEVMSIITVINCKGHPSYPRCFPLWFANYLNQSSFALPPVPSPVPKVN